MKKNKNTDELFITIFAKQPIKKEIADKIIKNYEVTLRTYNYPKNEKCILNSIDDLLDHAKNNLNIVNEKINLGYYYRLAVNLDYIF
jgi:hypothetical protein